MDGGTLRVGGREGQLLPLQVLAYGKGITGDLLDRSGLVAGPTSSGKTLVAEMRMMARWRRPAPARRHPARPPHPKKSAQIAKFA